MIRQQMLCDLWFHTPTHPPTQLRCSPFLHHNQYLHPWAHYLRNEWVGIWKISWYMTWTAGWQITTPNSSWLVLINISYIPHVDLPPVCLFKSVHTKVNTFMCLWQTYLLWLHKIMDALMIIYCENHAKMKATVFHSIFLVIFSVI